MSVSLQPCPLVESNHYQKSLASKTYSTITSKSEAISCHTFHNWPVQFIDKNQLAAVGFYYTDWKDLVYCAFYGVQLSQWEQEDDPFKERERWSPSCGFIKGLFVGNIPVGSSHQSTHNRDVCGPWRSKYSCLYLFFFCVHSLQLSSLIFIELFTAAQPWVFKHKIREQKTGVWCSPLFPQYDTISARMQSFNKLCLSAKRLSKAGFLNAAKN